ncbi:MAG: hypothetical protein E7309_07030 [Butyrivibrio sp.]|jgi:hypothetical protein|nr:hypothetical protein [Butyrivibrio sp.]
MDIKMASYLLTIHYLKNLSPVIESNILPLKVPSKILKTIPIKAIKKMAFRVSHLYDNPTRREAIAVSTPVIIASTTVLLNLYFPISHNPCIRVINDVTIIAPHIGNVYATKMQNAIPSVLEKGTLGSSSPKHMSLKSHTDLGFPLFFE